MAALQPASNVLLFPLCDARGDLLTALNDPGGKPGTRADALVLAWRLELPATMRLPCAARALLLVARSRPGRIWSEHQLQILDELKLLVRSESNKRRGLDSAWRQMLSGQKRRTAEKKSQRKTRSGRVLRENERHPDR